MEKAADIFFEHFNTSPGRSAADIYRIGEIFAEIPWENLTKFLLRSSGAHTLRHAEEVITGFVNSGTGGTCYSLTETLQGIMVACGLEARPLTGHMKQGKNTHCALLVEGEAGKFLLDPGYIVPGAVKLSESGEGEFCTSERKMFWRRAADGWELFTVENGRKHFRYCLESRVLLPGEFEKYWKNSFNASGLNSLYLNRTGPSGGRISAHNGNLRIVDGMGSRNLKLKENYPEKIRELFGISSDIAESAWTELQRFQGLRS